VNQPPVVIGEACDTITMCVGGEFHFDLAFTAPESNQNVTVTYTQSSTGFSATSVNSSTTLTNSAILNNATFLATDANVGINTVTITATDNGSPASTTVVTYVFDVDNVVPPPMEITGVTAICAGGETILTASEGFDSYTWSNGEVGLTASVTQQGPITVVGTYGNCSSVETINIDVTPYLFHNWKAETRLLKCAQGKLRKFVFLAIIRHMSGMFILAMMENLCQEQY
jgi:hypothetical protein